MSNEFDLKKIKPYCNQSSEKCIDDILRSISKTVLKKHAAQGEQITQEPTPQTKHIFDFSQPISGHTLSSLWKEIDCFNSEIAKAEAEISKNEYETNYTQTFYVDQLEKKYQHQANKALFSPAKKMMKLKATPEYRQKLYEAEAADARDTKAAQEKARHELKKWQNKLAELRESMRYYQPLYEKFIYWAQEAWRSFDTDIKKSYGGVFTKNLVNHILIFGLDGDWYDLPEKLLERAKDVFVEKEKRNSFEKLMRETDELIARANEYVRTHGGWGQ